MHGLHVWFKAFIHNGLQMSGKIYLSQLYKDGVCGLNLMKAHASGNGLNAIMFVRNYLLSIKRQTASVMMTFSQHAAPCAERERRGQNVVTIKID